MIDREHDLPIAKQAEALEISRGSVYDLPRLVPAADLAVMRRNLLRGLTIDRPNQVWAMEPKDRAATSPTFRWRVGWSTWPPSSSFDSLRMRWFSRRVLSWRLSITMETDFCVEALEEAMVRRGRPETFNTDRGSQFTSHAFTSVLREAGAAISMDGQGAWRDNVFADAALRVVERLWRSVKYEEIYLRAYDSVSMARASIGRYLAFSNGRRPHSSLDRRTPDQAYFDRLPHPAAA